MEISRDFLVAEVIIGFIITAIVTVFYGLVAPWYKQSAGRYIFGLLASLTLVLSNTVLRIFFPFIDNSRVLGAVLFGVYIIAIGLIGIGIYNAQVLRHDRKKFIKNEKDLHNPNKTSI